MSLKRTMTEAKREWTELPDWARHAAQFERRPCGVKNCEICAREYGAAS